MRKNLCIDGRTAEDVFEEVSRRLADRLKIDVTEDPKTEALIRIFARYCETIMQRVNIIPDRNYLAFIELLQLAPTLPVSANVPLTFKVVNGMPQPALPVVVKAGTQAAAPAKEGSPEPIVFETTRKLSLTPISLEKVLAIEPKIDSYSDLSDLASELGLIEVDPLSLRQPMPHQLFINHNAFFGTPTISTLKLSIDKPPTVEITTNREIEWFIVASDASSIPLAITSDTTNGLLRSGDVVLSVPSEWPQANVFNHEGGWLACRLLLSNDSYNKRIRRFDAEKERLSIRLTAHWSAETGPISSAFCNAKLLDLASEFLPLGESPKYGDSFYLNSHIFGMPDTLIELYFDVSNRSLTDGAVKIPWKSKSERPVLKWYFGNGNTWAELDVEDKTLSLTKSGNVQFDMPTVAKKMVVNGEEGFWIRVRLVSGDYGKPQSFEYNPDLGPSGYQQIESTLAPPVVSAITMSAGPSPPSSLVCHNGLTIHKPDVNKRFSPFCVKADEETALFLGFRDPAVDGSTLKKQPVEFYVHVANRLDKRQCVCDTSGTASQEIRWQYWNGGGWKDCKVNDTSDALRVPGLISLRVAEDIRPWQNSAINNELFWIRMTNNRDDLDNLASLSHIAVNTVPATHRLTLTNEVLGSSNGQPGLRFKTARAPVIGQFELEVLERHKEPYKTNITDGTTSRRIDGSMPRDKSGQSANWKLWKEVIDLSPSHATDRHFKINRESGEIIFGDNLHGQIPPNGVNNIRVRRYHTGGGRIGNTEAQTVNQLRSSIAYVDSVANSLHSTGGEDIESPISLMSRGSRWLRHRERAVTIEDYEDLARMASPIVARAKCYPNRDLSVLKEAWQLRPGTISLVIVPNYTDPRPIVDLPLLRHVHRYINERSPFDADLIVVGPRYVTVDINAKIVSQKPELEAGLIVACEHALNRFLHPVNGGTEGEGWNFGEPPYESDVYAILEDLPGMDFVREINLRANLDETHASDYGDYIICAGTHKITCDTDVSEKTTVGGMRR